MKVLQPKSRFRTARQQLARCDEVWVIQLLEQLYGSTAPGERLWPGSASAFRRRWAALGAVLGLSTEAGNDMSLGSLRGGGAWHFYALTEDLSRLQHRGRWARLETLQIYVQEVAPTEYMMKLKPATKLRIQSLASQLPAVLQAATELLDAHVPLSRWFGAIASALASAPPGSSL